MVGFADFLTFSEFRGRFYKIDRPIYIANVLTLVKPWYMRKFREHFVNTRRPAALKVDSERAAVKLAYRTARDRISSHPKPTTALRNVTVIGDGELLS